MSTYIHLVCLDHDPPLIAEDESGQHLYDLPRIRDEIAERAVVAAEADNPPVSGMDDITGYFRQRSSWFLALHRNCQIGICDEYGREHPVDEEVQP